MLGRWHLDPIIAGGLALVGSAYGVGLWWHSLRRREGEVWRALSFYVGLGAIYVALQSPLDEWSTHFFSVHQLQHLLLLQLAPVALVLPAPQARLIAGLPRAARRVLRAALSRRALRTCFRSFTHCATATLLLSAAILVWNEPGIHDAAVRDGALHDAMHLTLLAAGLIFWWRILDHRAPPRGAPYIYRLFMLEIAMMVGALLGGYLAMKQNELYTVYDRSGLAFPAQTDEMIGGFVLCFGAALLPLAVGGLVLRRWIGEWHVAAAGGVTSDQTAPR
jgi:putative membrane protein